MRENFNIYIYIYIEELILLLIDTFLKEYLFKKINKSIN